jgi:hypothetical protein
MGVLYCVGASASQFYNFVLKNRNTNFPAHNLCAPQAHPVDSTLLSLYHAVCCTLDGQHRVFDLVFQRYIVGDESGHFRGVLDSVVEDGRMHATAMALVCCQLCAQICISLTSRVLLGS